MEIFGGILIGIVLSGLALGIGMFLGAVHWSRNGPW